MFHIIASKVINSIEEWGKEYIEYLQGKDEAN